MLKKEVDLKKLLLIALLLFWVTPVLAQPPHSGNGPTYNMMTWWFNTTDPADTFWFPGVEVADVSTPGIDSVNIPITWGIDLLPYNYLGIEVAIITGDTTLNDTLAVDIYTGYYGDADSVILAVSLDSINYGGIFDTCINFPDCNKATKWVDLREHTYAAGATPSWFQRYVWLRLRTRMTEIFRTDTTFTSTVEANDLWQAADGDSLVDWWATGGDDSWESEIDEAIGSTDFDDFISVSVKDSLMVMGISVPIAESPGTIDSLVFTVVVKESLETTDPDLLRLGVVFGDSSLHYFWKLGTPIWATQQEVTSYFESAGHDTLSYLFTTDPYGDPWTRTTLDSAFVVFDPVYVDTVDAGTPGMMKLVQFWAKTYHSRTELFPELKGRVTVYLKE